MKGLHPIYKLAGVAAGVGVGVAAGVVYFKLQGKKKDYDTDSDNESTEEESEEEEEEEEEETPRRKQKNARKKQKTPPSRATNQKKPQKPALKPPQQPLRPNQAVENLLLQARQGQRNNQHQKVIKVCREALKRMESLPYYNPSAAKAEALFMLFESLFKSEAHAGSKEAYTEAITCLQSAKSTIDAIKSEAEKKSDRYLAMRTIIYCNVAELAVQMGDYEKAEPIAEEALKYVTELFGDDPKNLNIATMEFTLGTAQLFMRKYAEAKEHLQKAHEIFTKTHEFSHPMAIQAAIRYANSLNQLCKHDLAEKTLKDHMKKVTDKKLTMGMFYSLGRIAYDSERFREAEEHYKKSLSANPDNTPIAVYIHAALMQLYFEMGYQDKAQEQIRIMTDIFSQSNRFTSPYTDSKYLTTTKAQMHDPLPDRYLFAVELRKGADQTPKLKPGALLEFHFPRPNPSEGEEPEMVKTEIVQEGMTSVCVISDFFESKPRTGPQVQTHLVRVAIYSDASKTTHLGDHYQLFVEL